MIVGKIAELLVFGFAPLAFALALSPGSADADERTIRGDLVSGENAALPDNAVMTVEIAELPPTDASASRQSSP